MNQLRQLKGELLALANPGKARLLAGFFKTGVGQYAEGDIFLGIMVPQQRQLAKKYRGLGLDQIRSLLGDKFHEHRLVALFILADQYRRADDALKSELAEFYLAQSLRVNNWDLVDLSAPAILGDHLLRKGDTSLLHELAASDNLWQRRIAVLATFAFIKEGRFDQSFAVAEQLMQDSHDLIHKALGWMLREVGKKDQARERSFLERHAHLMPRTMLRYALERFDPEERAFWMEQKKRRAAGS